MHEHYLRKNCNKNRDFVSIQILTWQGRDKKKERMARGVRWGVDYSREAIVLNILVVKGGDYSRDGYYSKNI